MGIVKEFREFVMRGNVVDLAVGVIIGAAFGKTVTSLVEDVLMSPIGKLVGGLDFSNMYLSLSPVVDAKNAELARQAAAAAATQPVAEAGALESLTSVVQLTQFLPLAEAKKLGPVIAYGNFITVLINFLIVAFCIFLVIKAMNTAKRRFEREKAVEAAAPEVPPADVQLLAEIRDLLKAR
ncbi:MAG TPA: large conductance mechanosensitive channel protein MscL [Tepidisphaeraceae bacterium]|nr:large conductance mechanosensitive channel protein MscL [Tepidisphaeraceae bacterium]